MNGAIFFDLYGTLVDIHTDEDNPRFWCRLAHKTRKYKEYSPLNLKKNYHMLCDKYGKEKEEIEILDVFKELYDVKQEQAIMIARIFRKLSTEYIRLYSGVKGLLKDLTQNHYEIYLLSNAQESFTMPELKKLRIQRYFKGIAISSMYGVKKPNIEFFKQACKTFGIQQAIMIGNDYDCDIAPAKSLGWETIFIESNLTPKNQIEEKLVGFNKNVIYDLIQNK